MQNIFKVFLIVTLVSCNSTTSNNIQENKNDTSKATKNNNVAIADSQSADIKFDKYCNARFGYCIEYPKDIIFPEPESTNGDGRVFKNKKGEVILTVFGRNNSDPDFGHISIEQQFNNDLRESEEDKTKGQTVTYKKLGNNFFVISGVGKGKIFYQKTIIKNDAFAYAILEYDENDKATFDKISERIFKSFE